MVWEHLNFEMSLKKLVNLKLGFYKDSNLKRGFERFNFKVRVFKDLKRDFWKIWGFFEKFKALLLKDSNLKWGFL